MAVRWSDPVDEIVDGDEVVMLAYVSPARGVVLTPVTNFGIRDRDAGTITVNSSVGAWRKLDRMRRDPHVALAFHTRRHGRSERPEYVLVQGTARLSEPIPDYPSTVIDRWQRVERWSELGALRKRWLRVYAERVEIELCAERVMVWPDLRCDGEPEILGAPRPSTAPAPQEPPARGSGPRLNHRRAARVAARLPDVLLGWVGADRLPVAAPVGVAGTDDAGILLDPPRGIVPPGGRRAGLTAHSFAPRVVGQRQRVHTGWLEADPVLGRVAYAPHTAASYRFPASELLFHVVAGAATRWRMRSAPRRSTTRLPGGVRSGLSA